MKSKIYAVIIRDTQIALDEPVRILKEIVSQKVIAEDIYITVNPTPLNTVCEYSPIIMAINKNESVSKKIITDVAQSLDENEIKYDEYSMIIEWKGEKFRICDDTYT